ncbi:MAG TPA: hypothetical protein VFI65_15605 [Streptosporangiaceae bacterium]|nr:hypothetical protein [Streptosporangiaceae bacterium]
MTSPMGAPLRAVGEPVGPAGVGGPVGPAGPAGPAAGGRRPWPVILLAAYPPAWRARYGAELEWLVSDLRAGGRAQLPMAFDLFFGAVSAWITTGRGALMSERSKDALISVLWNWVAFAAIGAWFGHDLGIYPTAISAQQIAILHPPVPDAYNVLMAAGSFGVLATAVAGLAFAFDAVRFAARTGQRRLFLLMAVPVVVAASWLGGTALLPAVHSAGGLTVAVGWLLLGVAGIAASTQAVVTVIRKAEFEARTWRIGGIAAAAVTAAMVVATGSTIAWGIVERFSEAHPGDESGWLIVVAVMAVTTVRAVIALLRVSSRFAPGSARSTAAGPSEASA